MDSSTRYCFPSTATESMAVSWAISDTPAQPELTRAPQTDSDAQDRPSIILRDRHHIRTTRGFVVIRQFSGQWLNRSRWLGSALWFGADDDTKQVQEIILDYSRCHLDAPDYPETAPMPSDLVTMHFKTNSSNTDRPSAATWTKRPINATYGNGSVIHAVVPTTQCTLTFTIPNALNPPVLFYYRLTHFYQNHRRYAKSFDVDQLSGKAVSASTIHSSDCTPLTTTQVGNVSKPYYPCGVAANSVFNDTFSSPVLLNVPGQQVDNQTYYMRNSSGIAWESDKALYGQSAYNWADVAVPPNWVLRYPNNYSDDYHPDLVNDEQFQVWMRLAGLPTFSKLAQRNDTAVMQAGTYSVDINHRTSLSPFLAQAVSHSFTIPNTKQISMSPNMAAQNPSLLAPALLWAARILSSESPT